MDNSRNIHDQYILTRRGEHFRSAIYGLATVALAAITTVGVTEAGSRQSPSYTGEHSVEVESGDTVFGIAKNEVQGDVHDRREVVYEIVSRNPQIFQDGTPSLGSEDIGETLVVPDQVNSK
jgi:Tfp pilus assembly protein FimV